MATRSWAISQDGEAAYRVSDGGSFGAGKTKYLTVGYITDFKIRSYVQFVLDWTGMTSITAAVIRFKKSTSHGGWGASGRPIAKQIMASWTQGSKGSDGLWYSNNDLRWDTIPSTAGGVEVDGGTVNVSGGYYDVDVLAIVREWAAASISVGGSPGQGEANYGIELRGYSEVSGGAQTEAQSSDYGSGEPELIVTYSSNSAPTAPTWIAPTSGQIVESSGTPVYATPPTPDLIFDQNDAEGDAISAYDLQVSTDPTFASVTHWSLANQTSGIAGQRVTRTYAGTAFTRGATYYARARTKDAGTGTFSPWASVTFSINNAADPVISSPGSAQTAALSMVAGQTTPRLSVAWSTTDPNGHAQGYYRVWVFADAAGAVGTQLYDSTKTAGTATSLVPALNLTEGNYYHVRVETWDSLGLSKATATHRCRARWGSAHYVSTSLGAVSAWSILASKTLAAQQMVYIEYNSSTDGSTLPDAWQSDLSGVTFRAYFHYRVWMAGWGASPVSPSLESLEITYTATDRVADGWSGTDGLVDLSTFYNGTQSLKIAGDGTLRRRYQTVILKENTPYTLSARIKSQGNSGARIRLADTGGNVISSGGENIETPPVGATQDFIDQLSYYQFYRTPEGAGDAEYRIECVVDGLAGTAAWFDALMLEPSEVISPWNPAQIGLAAAIDAQGVQIDAYAGGVFRLRHSDGAQVVNLDEIVDAVLSGGSGAVATDTIWDAKGDLAAATGSDAATKLAVGANATVLTADSAEATGLKWVAPATLPIIKHKRTSGSIGANLAGTMTVTWGSAFADTNYTVLLSITNDGSVAVDETKRIIVEIVSYTASVVTVRVSNTFNATTNYVVHAMGIHD